MAESGEPAGEREVRAGGGGDRRLLRGFGFPIVIFTSYTFGILILGFRLQRFGLPNRISDQIQIEIYPPLPNDVIDDQILYIVTDNYEEIVESGVDISAIFNPARLGSSMVFCCCESVGIVICATC